MIIFAGTTPSISGLGFLWLALALVGGALIGALVFMLVPFCIYKVHEFAFCEDSSSRLDLASISFVVCLHELISFTNVSVSSAKNQGVP